MRLIDIDAFKADYSMADDCKYCKTPVRDCEYDMIYTRMDFCSWLDTAPTIEPERKKGEWIPAFDGKFTGGAYWFSCSKCNRIVTEVRNGGWNFCPQCGADMRGENDEADRR